MAREASFTLAAQQRHMTQPGLSRLIQRLERELGVRLFERHRAALELTTAGVRLRAYAEQVVFLHHQMLDELQDAVEPLSGDLSIASSTTAGEFLVPGLVAQFTAIYPQVHSQVFIADSVEVITEIRERRCDLGFTSAQIPSSNLDFILVAEDQVMLAVPASHPFAGREEVSLVELNGESFLEREGGSGTLISVRSALTYRNLPFPTYKVVMVLSTTHAIISAVQKGYGIGLVSSMALDTVDRRVMGVRLSELPRSRPIYLVREKLRVLSPAAEAFAEWVIKQGMPAMAEPA